ncbi:hypothetical protein EUGRSUZ_B02674 [Eucalyptus grandis]|uniref:Uncharacterized protein n=2 Tax=Eucalyptus grandis TaxID=71139 RepID=A0ACC3LTV7_EUCGR|nr:hypothetical protein EUGRSUZ_B02674 [Eucalyptus grandis]
MSFDTMTLMCFLHVTKNKVHMSFDMQPNMTTDKTPSWCIVLHVYEKATFIHHEILSLTQIQTINILFGPPQIHNKIFIKSYKLSGADLRFFG